MTRATRDPDAITSYKGLRCTQSERSDQVARDFRARGCAAIGWGSCSSPSTDTDRTYGLTPQEAAGALYDLLGDDMDGAAAMMEDMGF